MWLGRPRALRRRVQYLRHQAAERLCQSVLISAPQEMALRFGLLALAAFPTAAPAASAWSDDFATFNASLWTQQTDVEHCNDGACFNARPDHLSYGPRGLEVSLNQRPCNATPSACCVASKCAAWAAGHLASAAPALFGTFEITAQPAHSAGGSPPPKNAFSCWTPSYIGHPVHNEIAVCFSGLKSANTEIHFSYWFDATAHTTVKQLPFAWGAAMHTYRVVWAPTFISYLVDGVEMHRDTGVAGKTIPFTAGNELIIIRPKNAVYAGDSYFNVKSASYDPAY
jgi:hypothetical protein